MLPPVSVSVLCFDAFVFVLLSNVNQAFHSNSNRVTSTFNELIVTSTRCQRIYALNFEISNKNMYNENTTKKRWKICRNIQRKGKVIQFEQKMPLSLTCWFILCTVEILNLYRNLLFSTKRNLKLRSHEMALLSGNFLLHYVTNNIFLLLK